MGKLRYYVVYYDADLYAVDWDGGTGCNVIESLENWVQHLHDPQTFNTFWKLDGLVSLRFLNYSKSQLLRSLTRLSQNHLNGNNWIGLQHFFMFYVWKICGEDKCYRDLSSSDLPICRSNFIIGSFFSRLVRDLRVTSVQSCACMDQYSIQNHWQKGSATA